VHVAHRIAKNDLGAVRQFGVAEGEGRVLERHVHATWAADDFDLCIERLSAINIPIAGKPIPRSNELFPCSTA
jgi:hypothetical protein